MKEKYICVHGHFYQPPRENPWLNKVEIQDSAYPFHDWNHRINAECYRRNSASRIMNEGDKIEDIINNYAWMSFNMGPTLLAWMETEAPESYQAILDADKESQERFSGHGAALAQAYNHLIMPLANQKDKETQVIWGIEDFKSRFNRFPEGMWLGETAVNTDTLEILAKHGIKFTILSPYQAKNTRKIGEEEWKDATGAKVDPKRPYVCNLPSGNKINLFFYDGPASQAVAFEGLLNNGVRFADKLKGQFTDADEVQLVHIATDGESYGHHHKLGEMALSYCLHHINETKDAHLTIYGEFLEKFPPTHEAQIIEDTSWSCYHGVERWRSDCGCNTGGNEGWNQAWRKPLRETFDWIRENLIELYEEKMEPYTSEPWEVRNKYIKVILDRDAANVNAFLEENFGADLEDDEKIQILKLLEMQYHAMLMYTSCGWFFDEVTGIESMQDVMYASRAVQLAEEVGGPNLEEEFAARLEEVPSNLPEYGNARAAYDRFIRPMALDMIRIGAHYAVSSLFEDFPTEVSLYNFSATVKAKHYYEAGKQRLIIGRTQFRSDITWEKVDISYAVLYMGDRHLFGGVRKYMGEESLDELHKDVAELFKKGHTYEIFNKMDQHFGSHNYSFWHLFRDEQRSIMELVMDSTMQSAEGAMQLLYENTYPLLQTLKEINMKVPERLKLPVETVVNNKLISALREEPFDLLRFQRTLNSAMLIDIHLDLVTINYLADQLLNRLMWKLRDNPNDLETLQLVYELLSSVDDSPIDFNTWEAENITFDLRETAVPDIEEKQKNGDGNASAWLETYRKLEEKLNLAR